MAKIGLVVRTPFDKAIEKHALALIEWASKNSHEIILEKESAAVLGKTPGIPAEELVFNADPIVTLGGDGTLIGVARLAEKDGPVMLGVNFGTLGFLTEIAPEELLSSLELLFKGQATFESRTMLRAEVVRGKEIIFSSRAINDIVVQKGSRERILLLDLMVDGEFVMRVRGDGILFATPTGSTAYSLSAGGSIAHPSLPVTLITPICPHSLTSRPLVLPSSVTLTVKIPDYQGTVFTRLDGQVSSTLQAEDQVIISKTDSSVKFVRSPSQSYFDILRTKLNWGISSECS